MIGAIIGDIVGSRFEFVEDGIRGKNFNFFIENCRATDDTFMTLAIAKALLFSKGDKEKLKKCVVDCMKSIAYDHPNTGWGAKFYNFLFKDKYSKPYNSMGNGAGMRISPVAWVATTEEEVMELSRIVTEVSHNHPEGLKGAEAVAMAIFLARTGKDKNYIRKRMEEYYPIIKDKFFTIKDLSGRYGYDDYGNWVTCEGSIPHAIIAFLESTDFEDAVRNAVSIGGDSDTIGAMAGSIAEAYYGVPYELEEEALKYLSDDLTGIYYAFETIKKKRIKRDE